MIERLELTKYHHKNSTESARPAATVDDHEDESYMAQPEIIRELIEILPDRNRQSVTPDRVQHAQRLLDELSSLNLDEDSGKAAVLHLLTHEMPLHDAFFSKYLNPEIARLYQRISAMSVISNFTGTGATGKHITVEKLRRMLLAMIDDVRVVLVKLTHQLVMLKLSKNADDEYRQALAKQTLDIFAPLANRLGVWQLKWELEDYSLRYLNPEIYQSLASQLAERRADREKYIDSFIEKLKVGLNRHSIEAQVYGRPKHIYSIWRKMKRKNLDFDQIYDVRAVRILVNDITDCYSALGVVHTRWPNIAKEFDDYIAVPKKNGYRSIHTAVVSDSGKVIEVQIRTHEMHNENELGIAAHWRYKEGMSDIGLDNKILWLRQLLEWKDEVASAGDIIDEFKTEVADERIYLFTPRGQVIDLPHGATPLDFAYSVHTEVGHRCRGARVNGRIVSLNHKLETGQQVEVLTVKKGGPSRDWLSQDNGYVVTNRARSRIQRWFKEEDRDTNISQGRQILERELHRLGITHVNYEKLAQSKNFRRVDDMLAAIGFGDVKISQVVSGLAQPKERIARKKMPKRGRSTPGKTKDEIQIEGVGNLYTQLAKCCNPVPGDEIIGFITIGRGVTIHKGDCGNILRLDDKARDRLIQVNWSHRTEELYKTDITIKAYDRPGLLNDITSVFVAEMINVIRVNSISDKDKHLATIEVGIEIADLNKLSQALNKLSQIKNVIDVQRVSSA